MARDPGTYSEEIVREFYASYAATLRASISKRMKPLASGSAHFHDWFEGAVDISPATIRRFLYGPTADGGVLEWIRGPAFGHLEGNINFWPSSYGSWCVTVSPTKGDNVRSAWGEAVMVAALVEGVEINLPHILWRDI
ncbi:hypothetical protein H5410_060704 [Solanum commersonii]|uniref:Uncharacterized protein n=1 Tax=Solanum commersonii TaxID=4109 RepID=A0A9J5W5Z9_SOLCO|nr:hypothetical protein H5410_060704 [Solanum commersonii]